MDVKELGAMPFHGQPDVVSEIGNHYAVGCDGITLRQYFAGLALQGIMANPERWKQIATDYGSGKKTYEQCSAANAVKAVSLADALLEQLAKDPT